MTTPRKTLPARRAAETFTVVHRNQPVTITTGFYSDGTLGEIFINVSKSGTDLAHVAHDAAVAISLALQHGVPIESIRYAVTRNGASGAPASIIGAVIDALTGTAIRATTHINRGERS